MVVMDAGNLLLLFRPDVDIPLDSSTGKPVQAVQERLNFLVATLQKERTKIVIPTPALSELLVRAGSAGPALLEQISKAAVFRIVPFDTLAAVEVALMTKTALDQGDKRSGLTAPWTKVKFDRQIVAIAKVTQARTIYSDDGDVEKLGKDAGIPVVGLAALPLPPSSAQGVLNLESPQEPFSDAEEISEEELEALERDLAQDDRAEDEG